MAKLRQKTIGSIVYRLLSMVKNHRPSAIGHRPIAILILFLFCHPAFSQDEFRYDSKGKRNPFIPLVTSDGRLLKLDKEETSGELSIEGIIYDKNGRSYAIVNATVVEIGDFVSGYQVLKIEENKIIFIKDGQATEVEFKKED